LSIQTVLESCYPGRRALLKREILATALECFNSQGIETTTIEAIKDRCASSVGAIYHHFTNKDGIVAALFFCGLDDLGRMQENYLAQAQTPQEGIQALVFSYLDWVTAEPELARFQFQARSVLGKSEHAAELASRNKERNKVLKAWFAPPERQAFLATCPFELLLSLVIGQSENYCRAWLGQRVKTPPARYREALAMAAWRSVEAVASLY
jgi:AcrR family transcriptional regulator